MIPLLVTLVCCLLLGLEYGILFGVVSNAVFVLYSTSRPSIDFKVIKVRSQNQFLSNGYEIPPIHSKMTLKYC